MANLSNINGKFVVEQTTGNVGIGTADPDYLLHVNSSDVTNGTRLIIENTNGSGKKYGLIADNTGVFAVRDVTAGADRFSISNLGNATFAGSITTPSVLANGFMEIRSDTASLYFENAANNNYYRLKRSSNDFVIDYYNGTTTSDRLTIDSSGNVGIGLDPVYKLDVRGDRIRLNPNSNGFVTAEIQNTTGSFYFGIDNSTGTGFGGANSARCIFSLGDYPMAFYTNSTERMRIDSSGDVQARRPRSNTAGDVALSLQPTDSSIHYGFRIDSSTNSFNLDRVDSAGNLMIIDSSGTTTITNGTNDNTLLLLNGARGRRLRVQEHNTGNGGIAITSQDDDETGTTNVNNRTLLLNASGGNVGIGTTDPSFQLSIENHATTTSVATFEIDGKRTNGTDGPVGEMIFSNNGDTFATVAGFRDGADNKGSLQFQTQDSTFATRMTISSEGNVGIGVVNPETSRLLVRGSTNDSTSQIFQAANLGGATKYAIRADGDNKWYKSDNSLSMVLTSTGNVGIGTDSPNNLLNLQKDVAGGDVAAYIQNFNAATGSVDETASVKFAHGNDGVIGYVGGKLVCGKEGDFETSIANIKGFLSFYTASGTSLDSDVNNKERVRIDGEGKVIVYQYGNVSGFYLDGGNTRLYANGGGGTDYRGIECNSSGAWSWGETGSSNYFAKKVGIGTSTPYSILDINGVLTIGPASEDPNFTVTSTDVSTIAGGSLELVQGFGGTTAAGDTIVFTYAAQSWKAFQYEYCISAAYGLSKGGGGGYNNNGMTSYYYVTTNQGSNVNVTSVTSNSGGSGNQYVIVTITGNFGIHPCVSFKYTQSGGDGAPRADRATLAFNS